MCDKCENMGSMEKYLFKRMRMSAAGVVMTLLGVMTLLMPQSAFGKDIFDELADMPGVESTYVSGRFAGNYKRWSMMDRSLDLSMGFSSLYAYDLMSAASVSKAKTLLERYVKEHPELEVVMRKRQDTSEYLVLEQFGKDNKLYKWVIWDYRAPTSCEIVVINWKDGYAKESDK